MRRARSDKGVPVTHGYSITHKKLYKLYFSMRSRCEKPTDPAYHRYGGRGITVCEEWKTPEPFCEWALGHGYAAGLTLERMDNSAGYFPSNCTWATRTAQARNRRSNRLVAVKGEQKSIAEWADIFKMPQHRIQQRLRLGWPVERIFSEPPAHIGNWRG